MAIKRLLAILFAAVLGFAAVGCSSDDQKSSSTSVEVTMVKGSPDLPDFYGVPDPLPAGKPGQLINSESVDAPGLNGTMSRVMYHSTTINGQDIAVTGLILIPKGTAPSGGWPIITWAHGTTGIAGACAPSLKPDEFVTLANGLLDAGYLVVATDYEGLGTPVVTLTLLVKAKPAAPSTSCAWLKRSPTQTPQSGTWFGVILRVDMQQCSPDTSPRPTHLRLNSSPMLLVPPFTVAPHQCSSTNQSVQALHRNGCCCHECRVWRSES